MLCGGTCCRSLKGGEQQGALLAHCYTDWSAALLVCSLTGWLL